MATQQQQAQANIQQQNAWARAAVLGNSLDMRQQIYTNTIVPANTPVLNIAPRNVGLIKGFWVQITATIANAGASSASLSDFNVANLLSNVTFTDLNNNQRINTSGWHLAFLDTVKVRRPYGSSTASDSPIKYGSIDTTIVNAPATIANASSGTVYMMYWVPLAYSDDDLRGAVYANVVNATMNLQLTFNSTPGYTTGDSTLGIYGGTGTTVTISSATVTVFQNYLDQLPQTKNGPLLPPLDIATIYELKNTSLTGITTGQDFPVPYANYRQFLSTFAIYNNAGTRTNGSTDTNYWSLQTANYTNIFQVPPKQVHLWTRGIINTDYPLGVNYFDYRNKPVSTIQYGNMQLVFNPTGTVNAGANLLVGFEAFANVNTVVGAGSLAAS